MYTCTVYCSFIAACLLFFYMSKCTVHFHPVLVHCWYIYALSKLLHGIRYIDATGGSSYLRFVPDGWVNGFISLNNYAPHCRENASGQSWAAVEANPGWCCSMHYWSVPTQYAVTNGLAVLCTAISIV